MIPLKNLSRRFFIKYDKNGTLVLFDGKYIVCAQDGSIGATHIVHGKFWPNNHTHILTINDDILFNYNDFCFYFKVILIRSD